MSAAVLPREQWACPRCHLALFEGHAQDVVLNACGHCGGLWVDKNDSQRVTSKLSASAFDLANKASNAAQAIVATATEGLACPECRQAMGRQRYEPAHLDIDVCPAHGTWFDRGELVRVAKAAGAARTKPAATETEGEEGDDDGDSLAADIAGDVAVGVTIGLFEILLEALLD